jgi:site-specific recombinase XerC
VVRHILPACEYVRLSDVAYAEVCQWVAELSDLGLAPSTVRYSHRVFSLMMSHAVRDGRLARNPADGVKLPKITRGEPMFLDHGQGSSSPRQPRLTGCSSGSWRTSAAVG